VRLDTFDAQARPFSFYEKRGYVRFGEQPDCRIVRPRSRAFSSRRNAVPERRLA
jgi:hypothetical protein